MRQPRARAPSLPPPGSHALRNGKQSSAATTRDVRAFRAWNWKSGAAVMDSAWPMRLRARSTLREFAIDAAGIIVRGFLAGGETWTSSHGSGRSNCGIPSGSPWRWPWPPAGRRRSRPESVAAPGEWREFEGSWNAAGTPPHHSARRGSPGLDHRPERNDAARGAGAPRRRIPRGGDRARRQRNGPCRPQRLDGRARRPGVQRTQGRRHRRRKTTSRERSSAARAGMPARPVPTSSPGSS